MKSTDNGLHSASANAIDSLSGHAHRQSGPKGYLSAWIHALAGLKDIADNHIVHVGRLQLLQYGGCGDDA
jgi:hypothetical protein